MCGVKLEDQDKGAQIGKDMLPRVRARSGDYHVWCKLAIPRSNMYKLPTFTKPSGSESSLFDCSKLLLDLFAIRPFLSCGVRGVTSFYSPAAQRSTLHTHCSCLTHLSDQTAPLGHMHLLASTGFPLSPSCWDSKPSSPLLRPVHDPDCHVLSKRYGPRHSL